MSLHVSANPGRPQGSNLHLLEGTKTITFPVMVILHYSKIFISQMLPLRLATIGRYM